MPCQPISNNLSLPSAIQIDKATFVDSVRTSTIRCNQVILGTNATPLLASTPVVQGADASFGTVNMAVATTAFSSDNGVAGLTSNTLYFTVEGTVARLYFNQTGSAVLRATINLGTF